MDLIVSHNNADFDAFSSLIAAKKLYPNSKLLLPGSRERSVREFLSLTKDEIAIEDERTCDLSGIKRLIIVDTRQASRIGIAEKLLQDPSVEVHIYDHHPRTPHDIKGDKDIFQEVGATVSILTEMLKAKQGVRLTTLEATIMLLGVYEETGSLTYRTTTRLDVDTVSFLLSKGANLQAVSHYLNRKLTEEELAFLTTLIGSTKILNINGINVALASATIEKFVGELGTIVRKLEEVENFPVIFVLFKMGNKTRIIARSRLKDVDVNKIMQKFGGGGHRSAASARLEGKDAEGFEEKLPDILKSCIKVRIFARDIMSSPVKTIPSTVSVKEAKKTLQKFRAKGAPVMERGKLIGIITLTDIRKAEKYRYGHASVKGYMSRSVVTIDSDTPVHLIQKIMFEKAIGRLPVLKKGKLSGIVTRTDVLKSVHRDIFVKSHSVKKKRIRFNIAAKMKRVLPAEILKIMTDVGRAANKENLRVFVVGGFVRDILLGVKNFDMDIVLEGDAILFGKKISKTYKGSFVAYNKFGTATVIINWPKGMRKPEGAPPRFKIDFATARKESYEKPAALPTVEFSSIREDLRRRDFTINAMAASLNKSSFGQLIDFFGGERDLENGTIKVLHDGSFIDDPTRIFRAVRFEQRFGFRMDKYTEDLIKHAVREGMFSKTQNQRIRDEIILMLREKKPFKAIQRMKELHELRFIHKNLKIDNASAGLFDRIRTAYNRYGKSSFDNRHIDLWLVYLMGLLDNLNLADMKEICDKLVLRTRDRASLISGKKIYARAAKELFKTGLKDSSVYSLLEPLSFEATLFIMAKSGKKTVENKISDFFARHNKVKIKIRGGDLKKLGLKPGPLYTKILTKVLHEKIEGGVKTKKDEIKFVKRIINV